MATKKAKKKSSAASGAKHREFSADRGARISEMVNAVQGSKEGSDRFMADPAAVAKEYGVNLSSEEVQAVRFMNGIAVGGALSKLGRPSVAFWDHNCSCGGVLTRTGDGR